MKFYQFKKINDEVSELTIYGDITSWPWEEFGDVSASNFKKELDAVETATLEVRINSYGGEVKEGLAIYNLLKDFKGKVITINDGFACSIASVIFMAGQERIMPESSLLMIHNAWSGLWGDANALRKAADDLEKITSASLEIYKASSKLDESDIKEMLDAETWITAKEALAHGFATQVKEISVKQSMEEKTLFGTIMKLKNLEKENNELKMSQQSENPNSWDLFYGGKK